MPASPIRKLVPYAEAAKARGTKVYHLNIGQPDIATPEIAMEAIRHSTVKVLEYSHSAGIESYRRKLAGYYNHLGIDIDYSHVMITTGGSEALLFAVMSCLDEGDELIIPEPFYANYNSFAMTAGVKIIPVTASIENNFALPDVSAFKALITPRTKGIVINNPNNPTGYMYSQAELEGLRTVALEHDLYIFADEVYREFCYEGQVHTSVLSLEGLEKHAIVIDSVSKRYSMCGARIGALITRNMDVWNTALKFAQARLSPPTFGQIAAEAAIDVEPTYFTEVKEEYTKRRNLVVEGLNKIPGVYCPNPGGAFYAVVRLPIDNCDVFCQWLLESFSHNNQTVMLAPATGFYATPGKGLNEVRLAYVLNTEDLAKAIECLAVALEQYPGKLSDS